MIGTTVGSYLVTEKIAVGGMGTVYRAEHTLIGKQAAVKVLHPELCNNHDIVNRFFNEAKATTQIKHPGIVEVFDFGYLPSGDAYIIMEFLEGMSLARRLEARGTMQEGEAAMLLKSVCSALGAAHGKKIIHRDLKPDNIFLCPDPESATGERPKLLDFGIAKLTEGGVGLADTATKTGSVMGTPTYMSPEQCRGAGGIDHRSDLYSLGCIFYEIVTGRPPFLAEGAGELIGMHLFMEPDAPRKHNADLTDACEKLILSLLSKKPDQRPQTARELAVRLTELANKSGWITNTSPTGLTRQDITPLPDPRPSSVSGTEPTMASDPDITAPPPVAAPQPQRTMTPTTLSGAASAVMDVPKSSRRMWLAMGASVVLVGGIAGFALMGGRDKTTPARQPVEAPTAVEKAAPPAPMPAPAVEAPKPPVEEPKPPVEEPKPPVEATKPPPAKPAVTKPTTKPVVTKAATTPKPPTNPAKPDKPKKDKGKILIETDL